jgi:hypothetical protein
MFACNRCKVHLRGTDRSDDTLPRHILEGTLERML